MNRGHLDTIAAFLLVLVSITLIGCAPRTKSVALPLDSPQAFSASGAEAIPERWWTVFADTTLNSLVKQALQTNFNLETAWQRLRQAQAIVDRESATLFPDLEAVFQGEIGRPAFADEDTEQLRLGLTSTYEIDLWGRIGSTVDAEGFRAEATEADAHAASISLSAEITLAWARIGAAVEQLALIELKLVQQPAGDQQVRNASRRYGNDGHGGLRHPHRFTRMSSSSVSVEITRADAW